MTVRVERVFDIPAPRPAVWAFLADPENRANAISVVKGYEKTGELTATWQVTLPIPHLSKTVTVETEDIDRDEPSYVQFRGESTAMNVEGEHILEEINTGTRLTNRFHVEGRLPGVETYFKRKLDDELKNLEQAMREALEL